MGRRQAAQIDPTMAEDLSTVEYPPERPPAKRQRAKPEPRHGWRGRIGRLFVWTAVLLALCAAIFALYRLDEYAASDAHFVLRGDVLHHPGLAVTGMLHAPEARILGVFREDFGRSVYLMNVSERRRALLAIDWVRDAAVSRRWPNRLDVRIVERVPVAFAVFPAGGSKLIDAEGVLLDPPPRATFDLPVLRGIAPEQPLEIRRARAVQVAALIGELRPYATQISEIDVTDPENLKLTQVVNGNVIRLQLGNENYLARLQNFLTHYPGIVRRLPNARAFDLRLDDRIILEARPDGR
jgi:cell division protein FtsQ